MAIQVVTEGAPGISHGWLQAHGRTQGRHGFVTAPGIAEREAEFALCCGPAGLRGGERFNDAHCCGDVFGSTTGHGEEQRRGGMVRDGAEDFARLFGSELRLGHEQLFGVGQRHVQCSHGFRPARHPRVPVF